MVEEDVGEKASKVENGDDAIGRDCGGLTKGKREMELGETGDETEPMHADVDDPDKRQRDPDITADGGSAVHAENDLRKEEGEHLTMKPEGNHRNNNVNETSTSEKNEGGGRIGEPKETRVDDADGDEKMEKVTKSTKRKLKGKNNGTKGGTQSPEPRKPASQDVEMARGDCDDSMEDGDEEDESDTKSSGHDGDKDRNMMVISAERPVRERKSVDRLVTSVQRDTTKDLIIEQGTGIPLKDIPNVSYKLSKRKLDETLKMLHMILYGRRGKLYRIKNNISRFSGFVWHENEEKQRGKVKEKLEKWNRSQLLDACDVLDIPVVKTGTKKEDIIVKLMDFLLSPHETTAILLSEKEQSSKVKKMMKKNKKKNETKKVPKKNPKKRSEDVSEREDEEDEAGGEKVESEEDKSRNDNGFPGKSDIETAATAGRSESEDPDSEEERENRKRKRKGKKRTAITTATAAVSATASSNPSPKRVFSRKKKPEDVSSVPAKSGRSSSGGGRGKSKSEELAPPKDDELKTAICEILSQVDFNTATFTDILKHLVVRFKTDLTERKSSIKLMIQDELAKLADEDDDDDDGEEGDGNNDDDGDDGEGGGDARPLREA